MARSGERSLVEPAEPATPAVPLWGLVVRDCLALGLAVALTHADSRSPRTVDAAAFAFSFATAAFTTLSAFHGHEWGHYLGARLAGARPRGARSIVSLFLFELQRSECTRRQWLSMSLGGYLASILGLAIIASAVNLDAWSGKLTVVFVGLGVLATFAIEIPITMREWRRRDS